MYNFAYNMERIALTFTLFNEPRKLKEVSDSLTLFAQREGEWVNLNDELGPKGSLPIGKIEGLTVYLGSNTKAWLDFRTDNELGAEEKKESTKILDISKQEKRGKSNSLVQRYSSQQISPFFFTTRYVTKIDANRQSTLATSNLRATMKATRESRYESDLGPVSDFFSTVP